MFTGIVESLGKIEQIKGNIFTIAHDFTEPFSIGESIALSGMCSTVISTEPKKFDVEIMKESRNRTTFGAAHVGDLINLERAARSGERNSGHTVTGHIDEVGKILFCKKVDDFWLFRIEFSSQNSALVVQKGSIAVDGISLTISNVSEPPAKESWFEVSIISHTFDITTLGQKKTGDLVNLEFDILGKYFLRYQETLK